MSNRFASTYSDYQQASCQWLDSIPQHWIECRIKQIVSTPVTDGPHETPKFEDDGVPFLSAESVKNRKLDFSRKRGFISPELHRKYSKKYIPRRGDIYMVKSGATTGALAIVETDDEFNIWSPLAAIRCRKDICFDRFVFYTMQSEFFQRSIELSWSFGTQQNIGMGVIENLFIARPPLPEQKQIASFLDYETAKIDALIEKQQQLIALLGEKRQAVISHAVTKGLNPDAPMRDSGIDWLGEVPQHWTVVPFRHVFDVAGGQVDPRVAPYAEMPLIAPNHIESGTGRLLGIESAHDQGAISGKYLVGAGDIIYSKIRPSLRKVVLAPENCLCSADMYALRPKDGGSSAFFTWFLLSEYFSDIVVLESMRVAMPKANRESLAPIPVPVPPPNEQVDIGEYIDQRTQRLDDLESKANDQVELLQERRTALISAAVTGKIDVRGWKPPSSARMPETEMEVA